VHTREVIPQLEKQERGQRRVERQRQEETESRTKAGESRNLSPKGNEERVSGKESHIWRKANKGTEMTIGATCIREEQRLGMML
jgi:hypothetical protein